jgi:protein ImuB
MRRVACVALPEIRVEIAQEAQGDLGDSAARRPSPLAVVIARKGGTVKSELDVLGNTRVDVVSREARAAGIRAGQTVAAARAKHADLRVRVVAEDAVEGALARVAEVALAFGPAVSFDVATDVVWVEVGGCAHLHGGEEELARALEAGVRALGHACRVAVADGPRIASAVARFAETGKESPRRGARSTTHRAESIPGPMLRVPVGKGAAAMGALPIAALALESDVTRWLVDLGLRRCGDLQKLPRRSLGTRLGARAHDVMQLLDGEDRAPLDAWRPPEVPEERVELEWGAHSLEALAFVLKMLCDRLAARMHGRAMAATRLELVLTLDRALLPNALRESPAGRPIEGLPSRSPPVTGAIRLTPHASEPRSTLTIVLPAPLSRAADLLAVVRARLEHGSPPFTLAAPVLAAALRAPELTHAPGRTLDMLDPEPRATLALPRLVAELAAELGAARVGVLVLVDTWSPDERTRLVSYPWSGGLAGHRVTSALEPSRLVEPSRVLREELVTVYPLARFEATEWWRRGPRRRDVAAAWIDARTSPEGRALAWVELSDDGAVVRGWVD